MTTSKDKDEGFQTPIGEAAEGIGEGIVDAVESEADSFDGDDLINEAEAIVGEAAAVEDADALDKAQAEAKDWQDKYLRLHAEWDTYRRRTNEQRAAEKVRATEKLVCDLLPVLDDFERTIKYGRESGEEGLLGGIEAVQSKLLDVLKRSGVEIIDRAGEPFDALQEQAVAMVPNPDAYEETVADVYQKGYRMGDKVLRAAMVTVTTGGPTRPADEPEA